MPKREIQRPVPRVNPVATGIMYRTWPIVLAAMTAAGLPEPFALGQNAGSVYMDDSPAAQDGVARAIELAGVGNLEEAARVLQRLLDENADQLLPASERTDKDLFISVRQRVLAVLRESPTLLDRYRQSENAAALGLVETGQFELCERSRVMTTPGFDAALTLAQRHTDDARFFAAWYTLRQLDWHPDFAGPRAARACALLAAVRGYLLALPDAPIETQGDIARTLSQWREKAGIPDSEVKPASVPVIDTARGPLEPGPASDLSGVLPRPLASEFLGASLEGLTAMTTRGMQQRGIPERASVLQAVPAIAGDNVYLNDSETITAWDRFTLSKRWRVRIEPPSAIVQMATSGGMGLEDCNWVAVQGHRLATIGGLAMVSRAQTERAISVLDTRDGRVLWSTTLSQIGPEVLAECFPRGPVVIDQGVVVVSAARNSIEKRLQGAFLIGLDLQTGEMRWARNLGSMGAVPWGMNAFPADVSVVRAGVIYRADRVGVVTAVESVSGRTLWSRRLTPDPIVQQGSRSSRVVPWEGNTPVIHGEHLIVMSPDKREIVSLDCRTGKLLESKVPSQRLGNPDYLMLAPPASGNPGGAPRLIAVAPSLINMVDLDLPLSEAVAMRVAEVIAPGIRGRVSLAGDRLIIPVIEGVLTVQLPPSTEGPLEPAKLIKLDRGGHVLAVESQFIVVDDQQVHSYLLWDTANALLSKRMESEPANPAPAVTFAELAYQAGKHDRLISSIDRAIGAIESDPLSTGAANSRTRLFASMLEMVEPSPDNRSLAKLTDDLRGSVIDRVLQLAATPAEQVQALMAAGAYSEAGGQLAEAVERYQSVLVSPVLAVENYTKLGTTLPAEVEASRRVRRLVREHGRTVYAAYEQEAMSKLEQVKAAGDIPALERLARAYPVSRASPLAWLEVVGRHRTAGREMLALGALEEALGAAESALNPGDPLIGEIGGSLVTRIASSDRARAALRTLDEVERRLGSAVLTNEGSPIDRAALRASLQQKLELGERRPRFGSPSGAVSVLSGWGLLQPICGEAPGSPTDRVALGAAGGEVSIWKPVTAPGGAPSLEKLWTDPTAEAFVRMDARSVVLARRVGRSGQFDQSFTRRNIDTGTVIWEIPSFRALFNERSRRPFPVGDERIETPMRAQVPASELVVMVDDRTLALIDRVGRAAAFDYETGRMLWAGELPIDRVYDAALSEGALVVAGAPVRGAAALPDAAGEAEAIAQDAQIVSAVLCVGARTGQTQSIFGDTFETLWVRFTHEGMVVAGSERGLTLIDPYRGERRWRNENQPLHDSINAWTLPNRIIVRDNEGRLLSVNSVTGELDPKTIDTLGKAEQSFVEAEVRPLGDRSALVSMRGLVVYDKSGQLVAADALGTDTVVHLPRLGESAAVIVERAPRSSPDADPGPVSYAVHVVSLTNGRSLGTTPVELAMPPSDVAALDGMIIVSSGTACVLMHAPAPKP